MASAGRLQGLVAVITGAASGIGRATAKKFVENGAKVIIADRQVDLGEELAERLGSAASFVKCDVTKEADIATAVDTAVQQYGQLDIMFNNAGIVGERGPIDQTRVEEFDHTLDVNLRSTFLGIKHAARVMKERKTGVILSTASTAAKMGGLGPHGYATTKAGIVGLTRNAACELHKHHIRVNCILPGLVTTPLIRSLLGPDAETPSDEELGAMFADRMGFGGRTMVSEDIANLAVFLSSPESFFINGQDIVIDGGLTDLWRESVDQWFGTRQELLREAGKMGIPTGDD